MISLGSMISLGPTISLGSISSGYMISLRSMNYSGATGRGPPLALARKPAVLLVLLGFPCVVFDFALFVFAFLWISECVVLYEWFS